HVPRLADQLQSGRRRQRELHGETPGAQVVAELLSKQCLHVGLVIHHQDQEVHLLAPCSPSDAARRGKTTLNSVYSPGSVTTSIEPACCFTTMSWLSDRPRPVPSPAGLVVKKGVNSLSLTSAGIPVPLSRILISTRSPRSFVAAANTGSYAPLAWAA